jgi:hypothetical protein
MTRPPDWATAVPIDAMQTKIRNRKSVVAEVYLDFMASCYAPDSLLASAAFINFRIHLRRLYC